jgi:beta-lactamase superfamily II metal-dependent hydrolase
MAVTKKTTKREAPAKKNAAKRAVKDKTVKKKTTRKKPATKKPAPRKRPAKPPAQTPDQPSPPPVEGGTPSQSSGSGSTASLRVRMYRIGFGDFFLVSVPAAGGFKHILIDCGVHSKDTHSIIAAVNQMAQETGKELALIIVTHRHADHVTGFSKCKDVFSQFKVERIWMSWYEDPKDAKALAIQANIAAVASQVQQALAARADKDSDQYRNMVGNITEAMSATGGQQNPAAFEVLRSFPGNPPIDYYKAGDTPTLPPSLVNAGLSAQILGPPTDRTMVASTNKANEQYLASGVATEMSPITPFAPAFRVEPDVYPSTLFELIPRRLLEARITSVQPDMLAAKADMANNMINNQSLVTLLTFKGKTLLFAGDAQWGNWANFLFGNLTSTTLTKEASAMLSKLDFYKVGHHGSTNATPKDALAAMRAGCVAMCSTAIGAYNEVPRDALVTAIDQRTNNHLARSDQVAAGDAEPDPEAGKLPAGIFKAVYLADSKCGYIDYEV